MGGQRPRRQRQQGARRDADARGGTDRARALNAYLFFQEKTLGSLEAGKQADLVVLDRDYMTVPAAEIKRIKPTMTMVGGRVVFEDARR